MPCNPGYRDDGLTCHRPLSSIAKHSYTRGSRPEKDILGALKDVADKMKRAYEKARDFAADALEKARAFVSEVASKVADYAKQGFSAMVQGLKKAWDAFAGGMEWLRDKIVEVATKTVAGAIMPLMRMLKVPVSARDVDLGTRLAFRRMLEDPGTGKLDPLRLATASRRDSAPQCASFLGFDAIENKLQGAIAAALPVVGSFASDSVKEALKTAADKAAAQSLEKAQASLQSQGAMAAVSSIGTQPALWELIKQNATATATFKAVGIKLLLHVATFPVGYTTAYFGCYAEWKRSRKEFEDCYEREFVDRFAKNWLFDFFVNVPLAALEHILITPLTLKITISVTTAVTTALAAMSAGVGATMAPAVAFLTAFLTKVGIMTGIQLAIRMSPILPGGRTFFDLYSDTTWKGASSFFRSLIGKSARMFYCGTHDRQGASFRAPADETKPQEQKWHTRCGGKGVWPPGKRSADGGIHNPGGCPEVAFAVGDRRLECIDERYALYYTPDPPGSGAKSVAAAIATARLTAAPPPPPPAATFAKAPPSAPPRPAVRTEPAPAGINVASGKPAKQSSTAYGGDPRRAVDGNPSGQWGANSVTHTDLQTSPWWEVDLGAPHAIDEIRVYNRTDCCGDRLTKFLVGVSSAPGGPGWTYRHPGKADARTVVPVRQKGRYVRIWLPGKSHLSLAEVEVMGKPDTAVAAPASLQYGWLWCNKCQALAYSLAGPGACPAGGSHQSSGSFLYGVQHSASGGGGQRDWRWCNKCQVLAFAGVGARPCAARGKHDFKGAAATTSCSPRIRRPGPSGTGAGATSARSWRSPGIRRQPVRREGSTRAVAPTTS